MNFNSHYGNITVDGPGVVSQRIKASSDGISPAGYYGSFNPIRGAMSDDLGGGGKSPCWYKRVLSLLRGHRKCFSRGAGASFRAAPKGVPDNLSCQASPHPLALKVAAIMNCDIAGLINVAGNFNVFRCIISTGGTWDGFTAGISITV